jgi:hypothetical protein
MEQPGYSRTGCRREFGDIMPTFKPRHDPELEHYMEVRRDDIVD